MPDDEKHARVIEEGRLEIEAGQRQRPPSRAPRESKQVAATEAREKCPCCGRFMMDNLPALEDASTVRGINLLDQQWMFLDDLARELSLSRSEVARRAVEFVKREIRKDAQALSRIA